MDLLAEFDRVCKGHNIKYVVCGGTAIGAVRHKGFIPWDDDVDISMICSEYDKLCAIAGNSFREPYFCLIMKGSSIRKWRECVPDIMGGKNLIM